MPVARHLKQPTRTTRPGNRPPPLARRHRPYSVLLPVGLAMPSLLPGPRCALTAPFHPYPTGLAASRAVQSLWRFPWGRPRRTLSGTVFPWSPDFPPPPLQAGAAVRPTGEKRCARCWRPGQALCLGQDIEAAVTGWRRRCAPWRNRPGWHRSSAWPYGRSGISSQSGKCRRRPCDRPSPDT